MAIKIASPIKGYRLGTMRTEPAMSGFVAAEDRRLSINKVPELAGVLRWEKRPRPVGGNPSWTYIVNAPEGTFAVMVGHVEDNGHATPFEVWAPGDGPRGMSALAQSISMDMRTRDRKWLRRKLDALVKCRGESFVMRMPNGIETRVRSAVAAFASLCIHRCEELGAFDQYAGSTPLIDALLSKKEPRTTADGTLGWMVDVFNHATEDKFTLSLKEAERPDGKKRPLSVWLSGDYPKSLDGLCKSLSLDMRVGDTAWILRKVDQLIDNEEREKMGGFMAQVPGSEKSTWYPSTVAYIAALIKYRFKVLGYCDERGKPIGKTVLSVIENTEHRHDAKLNQGKDCSACGGVATVISQSGCDVCVACSTSRCG